MAEHGAVAGFAPDRFGGFGVPGNERTSDLSMGWQDPRVHSRATHSNEESRASGQPAFDPANVTRSGFERGDGRAGVDSSAQQRFHLGRPQTDGSRRPETNFEGLSTAAGPLGHDGTGGAANSKAVLAALRSLQEKIRALEEDRASLQSRLHASEETRVRDEQQHRLIQRQLQLQLQESVKSLTVRHEAESDAMRQHASKVHGEMQGTVETLQHRLAEADRKASSLQERVSQSAAPPRSMTQYRATAEETLSAREEELRTLRSSLVELEAASVALKKVNSRLEDQVVQQQAQREEISVNFTRMEEEIRSFKHAKAELEERTEALEGHCERLESDNDGMRRQLAAARDQIRDAEDRLAQQAEEVGQASGRSLGLEREKRQLEESLKNVLVINDQLLQKVYDVSLGQVPDDQLPAYLDADATKATETLRAKRTTAAKKKVTSTSHYTGHAFAQRPHYSGQTASSRPKRVPLTAYDAFPERAARRPTTTHDGVRKSKSSSNLTKDGNHAGSATAGVSPSLHAMDAADMVAHHGSAAPRMPMDDIKKLELELVEEVRQLRRQYREICAQVQGAESSQFDTQQLNVALRSVVDKLEKKGKQIQLIERMETQLGGARS